MSLFILVMGYVSLLIGCSENTLDSSTPVVESLRTPPEKTDEGWILGTPYHCDNPLSTTTYIDASTTFGNVENNYPVYNIEGSIALQNYDDTWWLWQVGSTNPFATNSDGDKVTLDSVSVTVRLYILDLNQDGEDDLLVFGEFIELYWSVLRPNEHKEILLNLEPSRGVRDIGTIDIDGDGDQDLWALLGTGGVDYHQGWGLIFEQKSDGTYGEPYEYIERDYFGAAFDGVVMDWEGDGDPDLYVCNDFGYYWGGNHVLINENGRLTDGDSNGADIATACMGISVADLDMDDHLDLYGTATAGQNFLKGGPDGFVDYTSAAEFPEATIDQMLWGAQITDYNNDGLFDIIVATSGFTKVDQNGPSVDSYPIWAIEQQPDHTFEEVGVQLGLEQNSASRAVLTHDINNDGVVDFIVSDATREAYVYLSDGCTENNWIEISGPDNSIVKVVANNTQWTIHLTKTPGMAASMPATVHIGLGNIDVVDWIELEIPWLGTRSLLGPIEPRQQISFVEP